MECNGPQCSTVGTNSPQLCSSDGDCECPSCSGQDLLKFAEIMWHKAAMAAMFEAKKERIKARIENSFGDHLDKGADTIVEAISKKIHLAVQSSNSEQELHSKLSSLLKECGK